MTSKNKAKKEVFTPADVKKTADAVMGVIGTNLNGTMDIAQIVINECLHRITQEKELRFCNPA